MKKHLYQHLSIMLACILFYGSSHSQTLPTDVLSQLNSYNVSWDAESTNGSMSSMPLGNGDITANVWVENNGDLMLYIGKSDSWSDGTRLLKIGRIRVHFTPNLFVSTNPFLQVLNLYKGEINISAGSSGSKIDLKVWIDANNPVIHIDAAGEQYFNIKCTTELLRPQVFILTNGSHPLANSFRGVTDGSVKPSESADELISKKDTVIWYHRNATTMYPTILKNENLSNVESKFPDPYLNRTFGALLKGNNLSTLNDSVIASGSAAKNFSISIYPYTAQTVSIEEWEKQLVSLVSKTDTISPNVAKKQHDAWWDGFWNRSWVFISGDNDAIALTRGYLLQRFMNACQGRGAYPMKFNGGMLTFDYNGKNGDYRNWGPAYWNQNNRHIYWPMLGSGDYEMMMPWFNMYMNMLGIQKEATKTYYGHDGAFFPETFNMFGLFILNDWGWGNTGKNSDTQWIRYHYSGALEVLSQMLDYYQYTGSDSFAVHYIIPYATEVIRFFDQHWSRQNGKIKFYPANALEEYWDCTNPTDYIAGLNYNIARLNLLPKNITTQVLLDEWNKCRNDLPQLPLSADSTRIKPAEEYGVTRNSENPECYTIFPYKLYGQGRANIDLALNTFGNRIFKWSGCWSQDPIQAPLLGLTDLAKKYVLENAKSLDPAVKFPAFWAPKSDYIPDLDNGGALMMAVQNMLIQNIDSEILVLPSWPSSWSVDYKLQAPYGTSVRIVSAGIQISKMEVYPSSRAVNIVLPDGKQNQTITFPSFPTMKVGITDVALSAVASSGLSISYKSSDTSIVTIVNGKIHAVTDGTAVITAYQIGNDKFNPSPEVKQTVNVTSMLSLKIEAEAYSGMSGIQTEDCAEGGKNLAFINDGDFTYYGKIDFGIRATSIDLRVAGNTAVENTAGNIEIRKGSKDGALLGSVTVPGTGGWQNWTTVSCELAGASGKFDVYLVYKNNCVFNVNWLQINGISDKYEAENFNGQEGISLEKCLEGSRDVTSIENGDYVYYNNIDFGDGATDLILRAASHVNKAIKAGTIELRLDSKEGILIGSMEVNGTGGNQFWENDTCQLSNASGMHNLFFFFKGGGNDNLFNINWFQILNGLSNKIEAENYTGQKGIFTETCNEGGKNLTMISDGDYTYYENVDFGSNAKSIDIRVAGSLTGIAGNIEFRIGSATGKLIGNAEVLATGGNWTTGSTELSDASGVQTLFLVFKGKCAFKVNWLQINGIKHDVNSYIEKVKNDNVILYPNPVEDFLNIELSCNNSDQVQFDVYNASGILVISKKIKNLHNISVKELTSGMYTAVISNDSQTYKLSFIKK